MQFDLNDSHVGVVQYSGAQAQEVVRLGDSNIRNITALKQYVRHDKTLHGNINYLWFKHPIAWMSLIMLFSGGFFCFFFRAVKELRWLAEATYTGEALEYSWNNMINQLGTNHSNSVVLVLTDGRSDTKRDKVSLNTLCGRGLQVRKAMHTFRIEGFFLISNMKLYILFILNLPCLVIVECTVLVSISLVYIFKFGNISFFRQILLD